jgi:hypothetical protein
MTRRPPASPGARAIVAVLVLVTGFWAFIITFSDYPPAWSTARWLAYVVMSLAPSAFVIGLLLPARWYLSLGVCWGALGLFAAPRLLVPILVSALAAGYLGSLVSRWRGRSRDESPSAPPAKDPRAS